MSEGWVFDRNQFALRTGLVAQAAEGGLASIWLTPEGAEFACRDSVGSRMSVRVPLAEGAEADEAVAGVVSAVSLRYMAQGCKGDKLTIRVTEDRLRVSDGRTDATAVMLRGQEPEAPLECPGGEMVATSRLIDACAAAKKASGNSSRVSPVMSGIQFLNVDGGSTYVVGTDTYRVHRTKLGWHMGEEANTLTVPSSSVNLLMKGLTDMECEVAWRGDKLTVGDSGLCIEFAGYADKPVDTRDVTAPLRSPEAVVRVDAREAAAAVRRIGAMVPRATVSITARPDTNELEIAARNEFGFACARLPAAVEGAELTVASTVDRLGDALGAIRGNAVLSFADRYQMFQIEGRQFLAVIAPVRPVH